MQCGESLGNRERSYVATFELIQDWGKNALLVANTRTLRSVYTAAVRLKVLRWIMKKLVRPEQVTLASSQEDQTGIVKCYCISEIQF
jgi:hypothetical protein